MGARTRTLNHRHAVAGSYWNRVALPQTVSRSKQHGYSKTCKDVIGNFPFPNPLLIEEKEEFVPALNGQLFSITDGSLLRKFSNFPSGYFVPDVDLSTEFPAPTLSAIADYSTKALAQSNPNTPHVSVPSFVGELKDLPSLIQAIGNNMLRLVALGYITKRWVVDPMINDLNALNSFASAANQRFKMLRALGDGKTLRRSVSMGKTSRQPAPSNVVIHSEGDWIEGTRTTTYTSNVWVSVSWTAASPSSIPTRGDDLHRLARQITGGFTSFDALATAWQLAPWSWLVDYFYDISTFIDANRGTVGVIPAGMCLMRTTQYESNVIQRSVPVHWSTLSGNPYKRITRKERWVLPGPLIPIPAFLGALTDSQWSILGSLSILNLSHTNKPYARMLRHEALGLGSRLSRVLDRVLTLGAR